MERYEQLVREYGDYLRARDFAAGTIILRERQLTLT